jgi:polyhydroxybutyrate depolymerase
MNRLVLALAAALATAGAAGAGCGPVAEPCAVAGGTYHVELPAGTAGPLPALLFLHGWGGTGEGTLSNRGMVQAFLARGYAVIAPDGQMRANGQGRTWDFLPEREVRRDETAFLRAVADDAARRFGLDRGRMLLAGFSIGGSMTSYLACADPAAFAAYAPVAGSFWRPHPVACAGPVRLLHLHGWTDVTVPLEGRDVGGATQGDVFAAMEIWRATNGCTALRPDAFGAEGDILRRRWTDCTPGSALEFALHPGAHGIPPGWAALAMDWFEGL